MKNNGEGNIKKVIMVGAGPVGLLTALMLGQRGIPCDVFEARHQVDDSPRGLAYGPAAVKVLRQAGILEKVMQRGFVPADVSWRKPSGEYIIGLEGLDMLTDPTHQTVVLPVGSLSALLLEEIQQQQSNCTSRSTTLHWGHRALGVGQDDNQAWVEVEVEENGAVTTQRHAADFVIGCDGGSSKVRKSLSGASFPGWTWPKQLVAVNVYMDFDRLGFSDFQWVIHPENWFVIARIDKQQGLWRVVYGETPGLSVDEIRSRLPERFRTTLPGHPDLSQYQLASVTPYVVHQRCAEKMRVGRVLLAGDAAHLNNPMGGLGLTTGVADVGSLIDCLCGIDSGEASMDDILDKYDEVRRQIFHQVVDVTSKANFHRIMQDTEADENDFAHKDPLFQLLAQARKDPSMAASLLKHELSIGCDMTQFYVQPSAKVVPSMVTV